MKTLEWFTKLLEGKKNRVQYGMLPSEQTRRSSGKQTDNTELKAGEHYFRLLLVEMFLADDRKWLTDWFPVVHTAINFKFGDQQELLTHVAGESYLKQLGQQKAGRIVGLNYPLTPLLPFNGGSIELDAGLVGVAGGNDILACLQILGSFSQLLVVPQLSAALAVAMPLADGVAKFIGATENQMLLGLHQLWSGESGGANVLKAGYFVVIDADTKINILQNLFVVDDGLRQGKNIETSTPVTGYDYMLFRIECRDERDDWDSLSAIQKPYERAIEMLGAGNIEQADAFIRTAIAAAFTAKELTAKVDRRRVIEQIKQAYKEASSFLGAAGAFADTGNLKLSELMQNAVRPAKASRGNLVPESIGLDGWINHSLKKNELALSFMPEDEKVTRSGTLNAGAENTTEPDRKERFFFALEGKHVKGDSVQKDSTIDLVFDYAIPKGDTVIFIKADELDKARSSDAAFGLTVSPRGFTFIDENESGCRQIQIKDGKFADGAVRFRLKAFDSKSYKKAFSGREKDIEKTNPEEFESPIFCTGFHIAFDIKGIQIYRFFLPVKLVDEITESNDLVQPLNFDLDKLNESGEYVTKARTDLREAVTKILKGKEAW